MKVHDPDPLVRGMDPRIRIRIHPKMTWIRNTDANYHKIDKFIYISGFSCGESRVRPVFSKQKTTTRIKKTEAGDGGGGLIN